MTNLKPCPFCGGNPELAMLGLVYCPDCGATIDVNNWNMRAGRTCFNASTRKDEGQFTCSACCSPVFISIVNCKRIIPNYCPTCGAKNEEVD